MAQQLPDDFPIDPVTTSGTALADILNRQQDRINTTNSGATAPVATFPGMMWLDTSGPGNGVLRMRDAANGAWLQLIDASSAGGGTSSRFADGTIAAPSIAFAAETGLGWYREGASRIALAAGGGKVAGLDLTAPASSGLALWPRAAGSSAFSLFSAPVGTANTDYFGVNKSAAQIDIGSFVAGSGTKKPMRFTSSGFNFDNTIQLDNATAIMRLQSSGAGNDSSLVLSKSAAAGANRIYGVTAAATRWTMDLGNGAGDFGISRYNVAGSLQDSPLSVPANTGDVHVARNLVVGVSNGSAGMPGSAGFVVNAAEQSMYMYGAGGGPGYRLFMALASGIVYLQSNGSIRMTWSLDNSMAAAGQCFKPGGGVWADSSDERIKENVQDYSRGLDAVLALRPVTYNFIEGTGRDTSMLYHGLIAQEAEQHMPEMVTQKDSKLGDVEYEDLRYLDTSALVYALVNAVKELHAKVEALEAR